jgi:hypothetical protein
MPTKQGDVSMLQDPVAQELLKSQIPARLAYVWTDGTPRVVPIAFHWDGQDIVMAGPTDAPKMSVLAKNPKVAITIDNNTMPYKVLYIRGTARLSVMDGIVPEYALAVKRYMGEEPGQAWLNQIAVLAPQMGRIAVKPEWVGILDFETRFPSAVEKAMEAAAGAGD